jgi:KamA family protein
VTDPNPSELVVYTRHDIDRLRELRRLPAEDRLAMKAVSAVLPFRVNRYVIDNLIDWGAVPEDPIFQLTFPQRGMLAPEAFDRMAGLVARGAPRDALRVAASEIRRGLNPNPAGQKDLNVPRHDGRPIPGLQHKYRETVVFFPSAGQTCHTYCSYCFRWSQFVGEPDLRFAAREAGTLVRYLRQHPEVTSVLVTGGDPLVMKSRTLGRYLEPLLAPELAHVTSIRIGTKATSYWPHRFTTDADADELLRVFERVRESGRTLALMAHYSHPRELEPTEASRALRRVQDAGAEVRCQAPLIRHVNDDAETWRELLDREVQLGAHPYYMFVERDTGARGYFEVPLGRAHRIFTNAWRRVTGLARTIRGPSMSCNPGKVLVDDIVEISGETFFALKFLQGRNPEWAGRVFFARYDERATWIDQLQPAFGAARFFFEEEMDAMQRTGLARPWRPDQRPPAAGPGGTRTPAGRSGLS